MPPTSTELLHPRRKLLAFLLASLLGPFGGEALAGPGPHPRSAFSAAGPGPNVPPLAPKRTATRKRPNKAHDTHYLFGPSAIPMEGGSGYYQNQDIVVHSAYFAPMDGLSFGGGVQLTSLFSSIASGGHGPMYHLRVNGGGDVGNGIQLGGFISGVQLGQDRAANDEVSLPTTLGLGAAQITFTRDLFNITVSTGVSMDREGFGDGPLLNLCGLWHLTSRTSLITENWNIPFGSENYQIYTYGARFTHRSMACDVAFAYNEDLAEIFVLGAPVLGFSLRFGAAGNALTR